MSNDTFQFDGPIADLVKKEEKKAAPITHRFYDYRTEILDIDEGWVYEKKRGGKKGPKIRKFFERLGHGYSDEGITFWKPKLNDIPACEASRWHALQYYTKQRAKIISAFDLVIKARPFCCIRTTKEWPGFAWIEFPKHKYHGADEGVSWDWWESHRQRNGEPPLDRPASPLKQDVGDAWFAYEERSRELRTRYGYFEMLFDMAIQKKYSQEFYRDRYATHMKNLVINGRNYLIGIKDGRQFGVIAYPENVITEEVL